MGWTVHTSADDANRVHLSDDRQQIQIQGTLTTDVECIASAPGFSSDGFYYFEVKMEELKPERYWEGMTMSMGFAWTYVVEDPELSRSFLVLGNDGFIRGLDLQKRHEKPSEFKWREYRCGDVVGCGVSVHDGVAFFTKNGAWYGEHKVEAMDDTNLRPYIRISVDPKEAAAVDLCTDFGNSGNRFNFDVKSYCTRKLAARSRKRLGLPTFPVELLAVIMEQIVPSALPDKLEKAAIANFCNCALVCYGWSTTFRPLLFHKIVLDSASTVRSLGRLIALSPSPCYHAGRFVRDLCVRSVVLSDKKDKFADPPAGLPLVLSSTLTPAFTNLEEIAWETPLQWPSLRLGTVPPRVELALPGLLHPLQRVHTLAIRNRTFNSFAQMLRIVRALRSLAELRLEQVAFLRAGPLRLAAFASAAARLKQLTVKGTLIPERMTQVELVLAVLRLAGVDEHDVAVVTEAVRTLVGAGGWYAAAEDRFVEKVEVLFRVEFQRDTGLTFELDLVPNTTPVGVCLSVKMTVDMADPAPASALPVPSFRVTFYSDFKPAPSHETPEFQTLLSRLDGSLVSLALGASPRRCRCVLRLGGEYRASVLEVHDRLSALMPRLHRQGRVVVEKAE